MVSAARALIARMRHAVAPTLAPARVAGHFSVIAPARRCFWQVCDDFGFQRDLFVWFVQPDWVAICDPGGGLASDLTDSVANITI